MTCDWPLAEPIANVNVYRTGALPHERGEARDAPTGRPRGDPRPSLDVEQGGPRFDGPSLDRRHRLRRGVEDDDRAHGRAASGDNLARVPRDEGGTDGYLISFGGVKKKATTVELHSVDTQVDEYA